MVVTHNSRIAHGLISYSFKIGGMKLIESHLNIKDSINELYKILK